jgi:hypothetical protein
LDYFVHCTRWSSRLPSRSTGQTHSTHIHHTHDTHTHTHTNDTAHTHTHTHTRHRTHTRQRTHTHTHTSTRTLTLTSVRLSLCIPWRGHPSHALTFSLPSIPPSHAPQATGAGHAVFFSEVDLASSKIVSPSSSILNRHHRRGLDIRRLNSMWQLFQFRESEITQFRSRRPDCTQDTPKGCRISHS